MVAILELANIEKRYKHNPLFSLSYKFQTTGLYAIYGSSGSGKTTLLNLIAEFERPDRGQIIKHFNKLEYVMQEHMLLTNITVRENLYIKLNVLNYKPGEYDEIIREICKKLSIDHLVDEKVSVLSGGEKQRVSLARALLNKPDCILLDEPTASIDYNLKQDLLQMLKKISTEMLMIVTTHDPVVKEYADTVLYLERGAFHE